MKKKVSVIVVTYNQRDSISRTLDHILSQRVDFPFEIVVGDDASADGTRAVCEEYARRYPEVVRLMPAAPNKGVTRNYFDCLESACGEYVADCAGDDYWIDPDKLAGQVAVLDSDPEIALVHTAWRTSAGETVCLDYPPVAGGRDVLLRLLRHDKPQPVHLCTAMYRRDAIMVEYTADREFFRSQCAEDLPIMAVLVARWKVAYMPEVTLCYSVGGDSVSNPARLSRAAGFYRASIGMTAALASRTGVSRRLIDPGLRKLGAYAMYLAIASGDPCAVDALDRTCSAVSLRLAFRTRVRRWLYGLKILMPVTDRERRR